MSGGANISNPSIEQRLGKLLIAIVAGEASADLHGANLVKAIRQIEPRTSFVGLGGPRMAAEGVKILVPAAETAVVGLSEVAKKIGNIAKAYFTLCRFLRKFRPSLLILIDFPDFNLRIAAKAKRWSIPIMYYISPQVWAWRSGRAKKIASLVDRIVCILPFEEDFYRQRGISVDYVGHPILDAIPGEIRRQDLREKIGLADSYPVVGIAPGSRDQEIQSLLPIMLRAVERLSKRYSCLSCLLPLAPTIDKNKIKALVGNFSIPLKIWSQSTYEVFSCCDCAIVASGTATLEAAIAEVPMVVAYKMSPLSFFLAKRVVKVDHISLVNLIAGYEAVPELIQEGVTPEQIERHLITILENSIARQKTIHALREVKEKLGTAGASSRAAEIAMTIIESHFGKQGQ